MEESLCDYMTIKNDNRFVVVGAGYVGMSIATLLGGKYDVVIYDNMHSKIEMINRGVSPVCDELIQLYLDLGKSSFKGTTNRFDAYRKASHIIVSVPTDYDEEINSFDTSIVEQVLQDILEVNSEAVIIVKSTVPIGFSDKIVNKWQNINLIYSPEFLQETKSFYDCLHPSRIIAGINEKSDRLVQYANEFIKIMEELSKKDSVEKMIVSYSEAESIKLFSNAYLALRISFFNELDTYSYEKRLRTDKIIKGVCLDPRIGDYYNNPSFGYGGYCLPKDTKQLLVDYKDIPEALIEAITESNQIRKEHISKCILEMANRFNINSHDEKNNTAARCQKNVCIGIFRIVMKKNSDNFRDSSIIGILDILKSSGAEIIIYEPLLSKEMSYRNNEIVNNIDEFKKRSVVIVANRYNTCLDDVKHKVFTRDLFERD